MQGTRWRADRGGWVAFLRMPLLPATLTCASGTIGFLAGMGYGLARTARLFNEIRWLRLGLRGEQAVAESLLAKYLHELPRALADQQIQQIAFQVEQKSRDVEF